MVRAVVGTLVEVGDARRDPESMASLLASRDRSAAGATAPARGLVLVRVLVLRAAGCALCARVLTEGPPREGVGVRAVKPVS